MRWFLQICFFSVCCFCCYAESSTQSLVLKVIRENKMICRTQYNCIKPILVNGSKIRALEIKVNGTESMNIITYDSNGAPSDIGDDFNIHVVGGREPAWIDANIIPADKKKK